MRLRARSLPSLAAFFVFVVALAVFGLQLRTLYTVPVFDSVRWGGDETWLMREFGNQALHGAMAYPESFRAPDGGSIPTRTDGVLAGSMWVDALMYGVPGFIFFPGHDYVSVGRTVTTALALALIASLYFILRKLGTTPLLASASVLLMVLCQGFVWVTHSARYDLLTGLTLIWYCYYLSRIREPSRLRMTIAGAIGVLIICASRHLLMLSLPATLVFLYGHRVWKQPVQMLSWLMGAVIAAVVLVLIYVMGTHEFSLFGRGGAEGSYSFVIHQIPILRPFSRNVQVSNLMERFHLFTVDAPGMLLLIAIAILFTILYKFRQWWLLRSGKHLKIASTNEQRFFLQCCVLCTISWLLTEGSRPYYLFHILPILIIGSAIILELWREVFATRWFGEAGAIVMMIIAIALGVGHAIPSPALGEAIARDQEAVIPRFLKEATNDSSRKSGILLDVAGLDRAITDTAHEVLTLDMFQPPSNAVSLVKKLDANKIDYVVLRSSAVGTPFEPGRALIPHVLDSIGEVQDSALGFFYDDGRNYEAGLSQLIDQGLDTLRLYRIRPK